MTAHSLIRFYPRAWRERYGEEFLETVGHGALHLQQVIDIVAGAIDAWLSADVRRATRTSAQLNGHGAGTMTQSLNAVCGDTKLRFTPRDGWWAGAVMIAGTFLLLALGIFARRNGMPVTGEILKGVAFPVSLTLTMPISILKGQPWRAQVVLVGGTLMLLVAAGYVASLI